MLGAHPAPLRAWVLLDGAEDPDVIRLDSFARDVLGVSAGDRVILRKLPTGEVPGGRAR